MSRVSSILVVDDDEDILDLFSYLLESEGYRVDTANCGVEALEKAMSNDYYLALLDFVLPDIKGTDVAKELYSNKRIQRVIFITGYDHVNKFIDPQMKEICKILTKPISSDLLIRSVRKAIESEPLFVNELVTISE